MGQAINHQWGDLNMLSSVIEIDLERVIYDTDYRQIQIERLLNEQNRLDSQLKDRQADINPDDVHDMSIPPFQCLQSQNL